MVRLYREIRAAYGWIADARKESTLKNDTVHERKQHQLARCTYGGNKHGRGSHAGEEESGDERIVVAVTMDGRRVVLGEHRHKNKPHDAHDHASIRTIKILSKNNHSCSSIHPSHNGQTDPAPHTGFMARPPLAHLATEIPRTI